MKKSDKLIIAGFLLVICIITAIHITIYAKYKKGEYSIYNVEDNQVAASMESFPGIKFISLRNIPASAAKFGDIAQVEKGFENQIQYSRNGDTLVITGREAINHRDIRDRATFTFPYNTTLSFFNSSLTLKTNNKSKEINTELHLQKSSALFFGKDNPLRFGYMKVFASDSSIASFKGNTQISNFEVQLSASAIEYGEGNFDQLTIVTDSVSRISLQTKNLLKAKITTVANQ
ncbi:MAG: hypothetical protein ABI480_07270 [Chitinophagaceae bacterium]